MISTTTRTSTLSSRLTSRSSIITPSLQHSPSSITPISTNLAASQTSLPSSVPSSGRLSNAAIGAVVGVAVLGALSILGMAIFFLRRRRQRRSEKLMEDDGLLSGAARPGFGGGGKPIDDMEDGRPDGIAMSDNLNVNSHQSPAPVYFRNRLSGNWFQPGHRGSRATIFQNPLGLHRPDSYDHRTNTFVWPAAAPDPSQRYNDKSGQQPDFEMHRKPVPPNLQLRIPNSQQVPPLHAYRSLSSLYQRPNDPQQTHQELSGDPVRHLSPMAVHEESTKVDGAHIPRSLTPGKASPGA
ncbi:MAG: hypothetical protein M4579_000299 [Chaenotheca gracillima]|nr:MAG: hypothetical protein M4579_000299 [Chaenotheca gracillima]